MIFYVIVLFRRFTKQTRVVGSNKVFIDSMLLNFIDIVIIQIKDITELEIISLVAYKYLIGQDLFDSIKKILSVWQPGLRYIFLVACGPEQIENSRSGFSYFLVENDEFLLQTFTNNCNIV